MSEVHVRPAMTRESVQAALKLYLVIFLALTAGVWGWYLIRRHAPHRFPLGDPVERFGDLIRFTPRPQIGGDPRMADTEHLLGTRYPRNYPPLASLIYIILLQECAPYAVFVFAGIVLGGMTAACVALWTRVKHLPAYRWYVGAAIFATGLLGYATQFTLIRANIEGILVLFVLLGALLYADRRYTASAVAFAVACCIKPYPVLWLFLLARHRRFKEAGWGIAAGAGITLLALLYFDPNPLRAWHIINGESTFFGNYVVAFRALQETMFDHSILQSMKTIVRVFVNHGIHFGVKERYSSGSYVPAARILYDIDLYLTMALAIVVARRAWRLPVLNQVFVLACVTTLFPVVANDYTLTVLLVPMGFGLIFLLHDVAEGRAHLSKRQMLAFVLPCVWLVAINPLWPLHGVVKCIALLVLLDAATRIPLKSTLFGEIDEVSRREVLADPDQPQFERQAHA